MAQMVRQQERTANNLANANTVGYRRDRAFTEALAQRLDAEGAPRTERHVTQWASEEQGAFEHTGNPLDLALSGEGFFVTGEEDGPRYTRAGRFVLDAGGFLRTPTGELVQGQGGPIQIPPRSGPVDVTGAGEVRAGGQRVGQLRIVRFADPMQLRRLDGAAFAAGTQTPEDVAHPTVMQGYVEQSNINAITEMTAMIEQFRLFESQQKVIQTTDQILGQVTRDLGRF